MTLTIQLPESKHVADPFLPDVCSQILKTQQTFSVETAGFLAYLGLCWWQFVKLPARCQRHSSVWLCLAVAAPLDEQLVVHQTPPLADKVISFCLIFKYKSEWEDKGMRVGIRFGHSRKMLWVWFSKSCQIVLQRLELSGRQGHSVLSPFSGVKVKAKVLVTRSCLILCLTLCNPMDCSPPSFSVCGISQRRILKWAIIISSSRGSSQLRDWTWVSCVAGRLYHLNYQGSLLRDGSSVELNF